MPTNSVHEVHLNLNVRGLPLSATLEINEISNRLIKEGRRVYKLGLGQSPFPVPQPVVEELRANAHQKDYLPVRGLTALQEAVVDYFERTQSLVYRPEHVLVGPGSKELMFILQLVYYGDLVIPTPSWVSYAPQAHIVGHQVRWIPTREDNSWLLTPEELERLCAKDPTKPRIVILNYPNNPTGYSYSDRQLQELAAVARKHRIILLSDEIYGELQFDGGHASIARYYPEGTIISSGLSKWCGAGGWRLGTFIFPKELDWLLEGMAAVASETFTATSAPIQYAAVRAFNGGTRIERYLWQSRRILATLGDYIHQRLVRMGLQLAPPQGGFYLFPDFEPLREKLAARGIGTSPELCKRLLDETGVAILPGTAFGRPEEELTVRLAYVDFDGARALAAAEQVPGGKDLDEAFLRQNCEKIVTAFDLIEEWLGQ
ncbi:pyridoxal phosphate-dependent aminotransferase [Geothermobacter hydrogeniphilus]|uniref:Aminotransferase n=1 Tax=Geothermobacter hydrogeniphilus TaxID=1969733 RepID=A0A1X0Y4V7_9BACT|nr:aminotransferase class I/II-fold pyridoxal phosphate-dependent enzyme [Geothermobacter hydrogeniphilus]ORJ60231.1 aspartate aminotransferase [Geothermobacter hydrogeniphilus]